MMLQKFLTKKNIRKTALVLADILLILLALLLCYNLRFDFNIPEFYTNGSYAIQVALIFVITFIISFALFSLYSSLWRYASVKELISIVYGITSGTIFAAFITYFTGTFIPRSIFIMMWFVTIIFIGSLRIGYRIFRRLKRSRFMGGFKRVLIVGAGYTGNMVLRELQENKEKTKLQAIGFIDDDPGKQGMKIQGIPVLGDRPCLLEVVLSYNVDEVIIAFPSAPQKVVRQVVQACTEAKVKVKIIPGVYELLNGTVQLEKLREVEISDLLGRDSVYLNTEDVAGYLQGETILVTGAGGSIGSEICRQIKLFNPKKLILLGRGENSIFDINSEFSSGPSDFTIIPIICDVRDMDAMKKVFEQFKPTVVFHAAAHKHVPLMEDNCEEAVKNNVFGSRNVVELSDKYKVKTFVMISTDKAVNPTNVMGITKRISEMIMQSKAISSSTRFCAVRFGNVLGSRGSVVPIFKKQIAAGGPVTVTHPKMTRYFMTIKEAASLVIQAGAMGKQGEIFVLEMGKPVKILEMAEDMIKLSGLEPYVDILIEFSGIRPGEKLHEELFTNSERLLTTKHERIFIMEPDEVSLKKFQKDVYNKINYLIDGKGSIQEKMINIVNN